MAKMVEKATFEERINHWVLAISFFALAITGFGFLIKHFAWLNAMFGGPFWASTIHKWGGLVFFASVMFTMSSYLAESLSFTDEDKEWFRLRGGYLSHEKIPPQGRLNAGQKLFYLTVLVMGLVISLSGVIMWVAGGSRGWMLIGHFFHNAAFVALVSALPIHIYLATAGNPGTFRIMTRGMVPLEWAKKRHAKWIKELGL